jgi:hypothetical protein
MDKGRILKFPVRGPFVVRVEREREDTGAWLVLSRDHAWAHGDRNKANLEAIAIACGFGVACSTAAP